jgi:hypothetical protein
MFHDQFKESLTSDMEMCVLKSFVQDVFNNMEKYIYLLKCKEITCPGMVVGNVKNNMIILILGVDFRKLF